MIDTIVPSHIEMAKAMRSMATLLSEANIVSPEGVTSIERAANRLYQKPGKDWFYTTPQEEPIQFELCRDRANREFIPKIGIDRIEVRDEAEQVPFSKWDINLLLEYSNQDVHCPRWHFDLCNPGQAGPITHLQYGGNKHPNKPNLDILVREPRWNVPPLDIILMCETVAANFYNKIWMERLKDDPQWNRIVQQSQRLCFPFFFRSMHNALNNTGVGSHLGASWNTISD